MSDFGLSFWSLFDWFTPMINPYSKKMMQFLPFPFLCTVFNVRKECLFILLFFRSIYWSLGVLTLDFIYRGAPRCFSTHCCRNFKILCPKCIDAMNICSWRFSYKIICFVTIQILSYLLGGKRFSFCMVYLPVLTFECVFWQEKWRTVKWKSWVNRILEPAQSQGRVPSYQVLVISLPF